MRRLLDAVGWPERAALALLMAWVAWSGVAAILSDRMPSLSSPYVVAPVALAVGVAAGGPLARHGASPRLHGWLLAASAVLVGGVLLTAEPGKEPLGYANANAALAVQVVTLCGLALLASPPRLRLLPAAALALALVAIVLNQSRTGIAVVLPLVLAVALMLWRPAVHRWWAVAVGAATLIAGASVILTLAGRAQWPPWAERAFDPVRRQLWGDAKALWLAHPLTGGGPGSFREATALSVDADTSSAHSSILQVGSETGWVGVAFLCLTTVAGLLWASRGTAKCAVVAAAGWTALLLHSLIDHLLEFPPVVIAAGLVLGWAAATAAPGSEQLDVAEGERPLPG